MNYRVRRVDPYWLTNPILPVLAIVGVAVGLFFASAGNLWAAVGGGLIGGIAIVLEVKPGITAVMGVFGLVGGLTTFIFSPRPDVAEMSPLLRGVSVIFFIAFYTALMDGIVLFVSVLYNLFAGPVGLEGFSVELEAEASEAGE
jgi:hypothetical protein